MESPLQQQTRHVRAQICMATECCNELTAANRDREVKLGPEVSLCSGLISVPFREEHGEARVARLARSCAASISGNQGSQEVCVVQHAGCRMNATCAANRSPGMELIDKNASFCYALVLWNFCEVEVAKLIFFYCQTQESASAESFQNAAPCQPAPTMPLCAYYASTTKLGSSPVSISQK